MTRRDKDMVREIKERMRGGDGQVELQHIFQDDEMKSKCRLFAKITLQPGCSIGRHAHDQEEELFYILTGTPEADDNGTIVTLQPGDALKTGGGEAHSIANRTDEPVVLLAVIPLY